MLGFIGQFLTLNEVAVMAMFLVFIWMLFRGIPVAMALVGVSLVFVLIAEFFLDPDQLVVFGQPVRPRICAAGRAAAHLG